MENRNFFKDVYDDFFGIEKLKKENEKMKQELGIREDYPSIELEKSRDNIAEDTITVPKTKEDKDIKMSGFFERIDKLFIKEESKETLKKIIQYQRKYNEGLEKEYITFNMCLYLKNRENIDEIIKLITEASLYFEYIKMGDAVETSFYDIEKVDEIEKIYSEENSFIVLKDFEGLVGSDSKFQERILHRLGEKTLEDGKFLTILLCKNKDILQQVFSNNAKLKNTAFELEIFEENPDIQDVYQAVLDKLKFSSKISEEFEVKLLDYIMITYKNTELSFAEYRDSLCKKILFNKKDEITVDDIPEYEKDKTVEEVFAELNELVGLKKVKQVLKDLVSLMELKSKTEGSLKIKDTNLHMVFLGNPGTGKTTVARLVAQILYNLKYIKQNKLIEVSSKDLVAEYVGQTAPKTMSVVEKALGGVLFVDEAYSLASGSGQGNSYNEEAIATLIQAMENNRDNLVVIFAGYTKEMQAFLDSNSGIVSRIGYTLEFDDYTEDELIQIFRNMLAKAGFEISENAIKEARRIIREYKDSKNFGNARVVRNLYEKTVIKHASNTLGKKSKKILKTIEENDISAENLLK